MRTKKLVFSLGIILFGLIVFILHMNRYSIYPTVPPPDESTSAYKLDRWTGEITFLQRVNEWTMKPPKQPK